MKRAAIYMRISTANQEKEETIGNQYMELIACIEEDGNQLITDCIYKDEGVVRHDTRATRFRQLSHRRCK
jgi:DNA invertase Pin-like site-specific DNA recombinase